MTGVRKRSLIHRIYAVHYTLGGMCLGAGSVDRAYRQMLGLVPIAAFTLACCQLALPRNHLKVLLRELGTSSLGRSSFLLLPPLLKARLKCTV